MSEQGETMDYENRVAEVYETADPRPDDTIEGMEYNPGSISKSNSDIEDEEEKFEMDLNNILSALSLNNDTFESVPNKKTKGKYETPEQKLQRLKSELEELKDDINKGNVEMEEGIDINTTLSSIESTELKLHQLEKKEDYFSNGNNSIMGNKLLEKVNKSLQKLNDPSKRELVYQPPIELVYKKEGTHAYKIENRIKSLESLLGPETQKPADVPEFMNFGGNMARVYELMKVIADSHHLEYVIKQIKSINAELEVINSENNRMRREELFHPDEIDIEVTNRVEQLMDVFDKLEPLLLQAPIFSSRLKALGGFHNEALDLILITDKIESLIKTADKDTRLAKDRAAMLSKNLDSAVNTINSRVSNIETKLSSLNERIQKLTQG
ncbi:hypothetical protein K502DRAFT_343131 [Neoconidiobolus thromboides FSU 785]|nr:hypothetical protein K502DRAFT_343131 [Neoconidiobolus thromboides FSU 785]